MKELSSHAGPYIRAHSNGSNLIVQDPYLGAGSHSLV